MILSPAGMPAIIFAYAISALILWGVLWLPFWWYAWNFGIVFAQLWLLCRLLRVVLRVAVRKWLGYPTRRRAATSVLLATAVLLICTAIGDSSLTMSWPEDWSGALQRVIVALHRPLLDRYSLHLYCDIPMPAAPLRHRWVGLLYFDEVHVTAAGVECYFPGARTSAIEWSQVPGKVRYEQRLSGDWHLMIPPARWSDPRPRDG
jgi:hypothetical protein